MSLNRNINKEVNSDKKSDYLIENEIQSESNEDFVAVGSDMIKEEDILEGHGCDVEDKGGITFLTHSILLVVSLSFTNSYFELKCSCC